LRKNETFEVSLLSPVRGGFLVGLNFGVTGFLPNSEIVSDAAAGKSLHVRIIELDEKKQRVIVSEKAVSFVSDVGKIESLFKIGEKINFTVLNITKSGIFGFVEKDGIKVEAFIKAEETAGLGVENLYDIYKRNQNIEAKVIDINKEKAQVLLSLREGKEGIEEKFKTGQKVSGKVAKVAKKGVTVSLPGSVYGLIEASRVLADKVYEVGEEVEAEVLGFDKKKGVFLLSPILRTKPIGYR
jgi:small subunit ribosomal protein S1